MRRVNSDQFRRSFCFIACGIMAILPGCKKDTSEAQAAAAPMVTVAPAIERDVIQYEYETGRVEAEQKVDIRARVSGHLVKIHFQPGTEIAAGTPLFEID